MSDKTLTRDGMNVYTSEELAKILADERRADINLKDRTSQTDAARQIGEETRAIYAGAKNAAGRRIERSTERNSNAFLLAVSRGNIASAFPLMAVVHNSLLLQHLTALVVPAAAAETSKVGAAFEDAEAAVYGCGDSLMIGFATMAVPESVKAQLDAEILQIKNAEDALARRYDGGYYGPFLEEEAYSNLKDRYLVCTNPETGEHAHIADRVEALAEQARLQNPGAPQVVCNADVCYILRPGANGSMGQRVHMSHALNNDGELNITPQMEAKIEALQPVPRP